MLNDLTSKELQQRFKKKHFCLTQGAFSKFLERKELASTIEPPEPSENSLLAPVFVAVPSPPRLDVDGLSYVPGEDGVRPEIKRLVAIANAIAAKKRNKNQKRHRHHQQVDLVHSHPFGVLFIVTHLFIRMQERNLAFISPTLVRFGNLVREATLPPNSNRKPPNQQNDKTKTQFLI